MIARRRLSHIGVTILLLAIVCLGAGLRLYELQAQSVDGNEAFSILMSRLPLPAITPELLKDVLHPPLYQYTLHGWFAILGSSVLQARLLSALFGIAAVGMIYWLGAVTLGRRTGLIAALLLAVSQLGVAYSQEVRSYSMVLFLNVLTIFLFWMAARRRAVRWWIGFLLASSALMQTHYSAALTVGVLFCYALVARPRPIPVKWLACGALFLAVSFGPWLSTGIVQQAVNSKKTHPRALPPWAAVSGVTAFKDLDLFSDGGWNGPESSPPLWTIVAGAILFCVPALLSFRCTWCSRSSHARNVCGLMAALWIVPAVVLLVLGRLGLQYHVRYLLFAIAPYYILVAYGITLLPVRLRPVHLAAIALYGLGSVLVLNAAPYKPNTRDAFAEMLRSYQPGDLCVFSWNVVPRQWYVYYPDRRVDVERLEDLEKTVPAKRIWVLILNEGKGPSSSKLAVTHERAFTRQYFEVDLSLYVPKAHSLTRE